MRTRVFSTLLGLVALAAPRVVVVRRDAGPVVAAEARAADRFREVSGTNLILRPPLVKTPQGDVIMTNVLMKLTD